MSLYMHFAKLAAFSAIIRIKTLKKLGLYQILACEMCALQDFKIETIVMNHAFCILQCKKTRLL